MTHQSTPSGGEGRTILGMLETTAAMPPRPSERFSGVEWAPIGPDLDWEPRPLARAIRTGRRFRWPFVITSILLATTTLGVIHYGLRFPQAHAQQRSIEFALAAADTSVALDGARIAAVLITDAGATSNEMTTAVGPLLRLETSAARLAETSRLWLLDLPDPYPTAQLDDLTAGRNQLRAVSGAVAVLTDRLRRTAEYRLTLATMLRWPSLPSMANPLPATDAERAISDLLAGAVTALGTLPDEPALRSHRDRAAELIVWLGEWQSGYMTALQVGDLTDAVRIERQAQDRIADLNLALLPPLAEVQASAIEAFDALDWQLTEATVLVGS